MDHSTDSVVIVGGGHNGLVAAAYLAQAGKSVTLLERLDHVGGAAVSAQAFDGVDARLSRYSYLVSLLPERIIRELKLDIRLERRRYASYTPLPGTDHGLLVDNADAAATAESFASVGAAADVAPWHDFYAGTAVLARGLYDLLCGLDDTTSVESLLGTEGQGAALYFGEFGRFLKPAPGRGFDFTARNRRPLRDPVNALLSFAYAMLAKDCFAAACVDGTAGRG